MPEPQREHGQIALDETSVSMGGLFRCCVASLSTWAMEQPKGAMVTEGDRVRCLGCEGGVILRGDRWVWDEDQP